MTTTTTPTIPGPAVTNPPDFPKTKPQPVLMVMAIVVALQVLVSSTALTDALPKNALGILNTAIAALSAALAFYLRSQVVPLQDVVSYYDKDRNLSKTTRPTPNANP